MTVGLQARAAFVDSIDLPMREAASCRLRLDPAGCWRIVGASRPFLDLIGRGHDEIMDAPLADVLGIAQSALNRLIRRDGGPDSAVETEIALLLRHGRTQARATFVPLAARPEGGAEVLAILGAVQHAGAGVGPGSLSPEAEMPADLFLRYRTDLTVVDCSEGYAALYSRSPADLIGRNAADWVPPEILRNARPAVSRVDLGQIVNTHEAERRLPDGRLRWYRWIELAAPVEAGRPPEIIAIGVDVTPLKLAKARLRDAIESINEGFCLFDRDEKLVLVNQRIRDMYPKAAPSMNDGMDMTEMFRICAASGDLGPVEDPASFADKMTAQIRAQAAIRYQRQLPDGRWILVSQQRTTDGGYVGVRTDITTVKANEEALQRAGEELARKNAALVRLADELRLARVAAEDSNRAKSRFLAHMSHELRTPLNSVIGFADIMRAGLFGPIEPARYREYVELIHNSGALLLSLINDVLDMSKIEAGKMQLTIETCETTALAEACRALVIGMARDSSVALKVEIDPDCREIRADERAAKQMIINLLSNAVKFTPAGGVVTLDFHNIDAEWVAISVIDTGIGMTPAELKKAMQPFGQVDSELARLRKGTGIGLTLAKSLAELHGGTLSLVSEKGVGTTATITLPRSKPAA